MIYTVTLNPSLDYITTLEHFTPGTVNRTTGETILAGGKGINVSILLSNLGIQSTALGFVAGFTGRELLSRLSCHNFLCNFIEVPEGLTRINVKIQSPHPIPDNAAPTFNPPLNETEINGMGPAITEECTRKLLQQIKALASKDYLVLSGSIPPSMPSDIYTQIMEITRSTCTPVILDTSSAALMDALPYRPFLIKPNRHELEALFHVKLNTVEDLILYGRKLLTAGAKNVLISMDCDGAILLCDNGCVYQKSAPQGRVVNSVGAGDSMVAGFLSGWLDTGDYEYALKKGIASGSASAFSLHLATLPEINELMASIE